MPPSDILSLRGALGNTANRFLASATARVCLSDLAHGSSLGGGLHDLAGRSVLVLVNDQLLTALVLIELDGVAARLTICPPDLSSEHLGSVIANVGADAIVSDQTALAHGGLHVRCSSAIAPVADVRIDCRSTEWILLTSGTAGKPKILVHSLRSLTGTTKINEQHEDAIVWGSFYDIRRFAGLQVFLQAILGGGSLVLSSPDESLGDYVARLGALRATHISGTPSQWRFALMWPSALTIEPRQLTLGGEIVDQTILNNLRSFYPRARITHIYASTEAGVGFAVSDGLEGFPASIIGQRRDGVELKIEKGALWVRSPRIAARCVSAESPTLTDVNGFVDTGDSVERRGERYYFLGRRGAVINVGGLKVYPEEVEAVINRHPEVQMSHVRSRSNGIMGSIVVADVVPRVPSDQGGASAELRREILQNCYEALPRYKVPATIRFVPALNVGASGKLARHHA